MEDTKYFQGLCELQYEKDTVKETREITHIISTDSKDRHKDILDMDKWALDNYNANPIVGYQHNVYGDNMCNAPNPDDVIGKSVVAIDTYKGRKVLIAKATYEPREMNPTAGKVLDKLLFGSLKAASVGILPLGEFEYVNPRKSDGRIYDWDERRWKGQELLEWSVVNIPANQDATVIRRSLKNHTNAALKFVQTMLEDYGMKDIKEMKVKEILDLIDKKHVNPPTEELEKELSGPDPDFEKYKLRLNKLKQQ